MARALLLLVLLLDLVAALAVLTRPAAAAGEHVAVARLSGIVNPPAAQYVDRALSEAEHGGAVLFVLELDTSGGLDTSMRAIVQRILASRIPVVVYVSPPGARAGSAGVYIAYSAHLAAMAPNTNIGSATPVALGPGGAGSISSELRDKAVNDAAALLRGLARARGRNADWADEAVRHASNIGAYEALQLGVVSHLASDLDDLLRQLDGAHVRLSGADDTATPPREVMLHTAGRPVQRLAMQPLESLLHVIGDSTVAYLLLSLGLLALAYELANPGAIVPGVVGGLALLLALYTLGTLPVNLAGLLLIGLALVLLVVDTVASSHGALTLGAIAAFVLGSAVLIDAPAGAPYLAIAPLAIAAMAMTFALLFGLLSWSVLRTQRRRALGGTASLIGQLAEAREALVPSGLVAVAGELWQATAERGLVAKGELVEITAVDGLRLGVRRLDRPARRHELPLRRSA